MRCSSPSKLAIACSGTMLAAAADGPTPCALVAAVLADLIAGEHPPAGVEAAARAAAHSTSEAAQTQRHGCRLQLDEELSDR